MGRLAETYDFAIQTVADIERAAVQLRCAGEALGGFRVATCDNIASKIPMQDGMGNVLAESVFGWTEPDERWWDNKLLALISPLPRACRYESEPFWCNATGFFTRQPNPYLKSIQIGDLETYINALAVIVVPIHLPFGQIGAVSWTPTDGQSDLSAEFDQYGDDLQLLSQRFITGYFKVMRHDTWLPADCQLTKREVECLRWAAMGKTDKEISMILSRSHATIRFHIHNAGEKLLSVNRSQTLFKAAQLGYIGLSN
jgi:DNA-binding CsgD family transcriptional regulator